MISNGNHIYQAFLGTLLTWFVTALGSSLVYFINNDKKFLDASLGFSAGVMISASIWSLLVPAVEIAKQQYFKNCPYVPVSLGFIFGVVFIYLTDVYLSNYQILANITITKPKPTLISKNKNLINRKKQSHQHKPELQSDKSPFFIKKKFFLMICAIFAHNIPEGLAVGVSFANADTVESFNKARILTVGIAIQNFPEGLAISLPLKCAGLSNHKSFMYGQLSGMVEPISGVIGAVFTLTISSLLPIVLAFAAGAMIYVVFDEIAPEIAGGTTTYQNMKYLFGCIPSKNEFNYLPKAAFKLRFGVSLSLVFKENFMPIPLMDLVNYLTQRGCAAENIFRRPGSRMEQTIICKSLNEGIPIYYDKYSFYTLASVFKVFLLQIPDGIFGKEVEDKLLDCLELKDVDSQLDYIRTILDIFPPVRQRLVALILGMWHKVTKYSDLNGMQLGVLAKCVAGSFFLHSCTSSLEKINRAVEVLKLLIHYFNHARLLGFSKIRYFCDITNTTMCVIDSNNKKILMIPNNIDFISDYQNFDKKVNLSNAKSLQNVDDKSVASSKSIVLKSHSENIEKSSMDLKLRQLARIYHRSMWFSSATCSYTSDSANEIKTENIGNINAKSEENYLCDFSVNTCEKKLDKKFPKKNKSEENILHNVENKKFYEIIKKTKPRKFSEAIALSSGSTTKTSKISKLLYSIKNFKLSGVNIYKREDSLELETQ
ncbi:hypothetical protein A3Q56_00084 [Intoshia linei]|uniref:Zinc transporter ZIP11 n=1 Tax=Intoshia linei TaxID=1819745 RepID=A0A177BEM4_9BILA|nr:hypothetical protein A3Q56_00084 [Intoshia linei]